MAFVSPSIHMVSPSKSLSLQSVLFSFVSVFGTACRLLKFLISVCLPFTLSWVISVSPQVIRRTLLLSPWIPLLQASVPPLPSAISCHAHCLDLVTRMGTPSAISVVRLSPSNTAFSSSLLTLP